MKEKKRTGRALAASILSLSLLTVMAGAAVAPALGVIREAFAGESQILIQMIISVPALFIFAANLIFPKLCARMGSRSLVLTGLLLYTFGGVMAGVFSNIWLLLAMRAVVGIGVNVCEPRGGFDPAIRGIAGAIWKPEERKDGEADREEGKD